MQHAPHDLAEAGTMWISRVEAMGEIPCGGPTPYGRRRRGRTARAPRRRRTWRRLPATTSPWLRSTRWPRTMPRRKALPSSSTTPAQRSQAARACGTGLGGVAPGSCEIMMAPVSVSHQGEPAAEAAATAPTRGPVSVSRTRFCRLVRAQAAVTPTVALTPEISSSASATIRATSSAHVGMSWISPTTKPAVQMPASTSPVS